MTVQAVPLAATSSPYATQGMIAPSTEFVDGAGMLMPVSFRFLYGLFSAIGALQGQIAALQAQVAALAPPP